MFLDYYYFLSTIKSYKPLSMNYILMIYNINVLFQKNKQIIKDLWSLFLLWYWISPLYAFELYKFTISLIAYCIGLFAY